MYIKKIRSFIALARSDSFREAADKLNITQPTLTKQIQLLEEILGYKLFVRDNQGCHLTDEGKVIYKYSINLSDEFDKFLNIAKKIKTGKTGVLNIGYTFSFINILPEIINKYTELHPVINIKVHELASSEQERRLLSGELDIAFMEKPANKNIKHEEISTDHLLIISNQENNFQLNGIEDIIQILDENTLCLPNCDLHFDLANKISNFLSINSIYSQNINYTNNVYNILSMANLHSNITILPNSLVHNFKPNIKYEKLMGKGSKWNIGVSWHKVRASNDALTFVNEIKNI